MGKIIKLYNTWEKVKHIFVKPSLKVLFFTKSYLRGPIIYICPRKWLFSKCHNLKNGAYISIGTKTMTLGDKEYSTKVYDYTKHQLPNNLKQYDIVWNSNIRRKLKKWHLNWIKPVIYLPRWMRFKIENYDVQWKYKFDDIRYEFPPKFSIIAFGRQLTFTLQSPVQDDFALDDSYWEAILNHIYSNKTGTLKETIELTGIWKKLGQTKKDDVEYFAVRPDFITDEYLDEYYTAVSEIKRDKNKFIL